MRITMYRLGSCCRIIASRAKMHVLVGYNVTHTGWFRYVVVGWLVGWYARGLGLVQTQPRWVGSD
jgi:hypothetical protein